MVPYHEYEGGKKAYSNITYTILNRLQNIGFTVNQVMDKIHKIITTLKVQAMDKSSFFDNMKEVQVTTDSMSYTYRGVRGR